MLAFVGACGGELQGEDTRAPAVPASRAGTEIVGTAAPPLPTMAWIGEPLAIEALRGRVVLVRFWTDTCPYCRATAPALRELDADYRAQGLTVVGIYHPKPRGSVRDHAEVTAMAQALGWEFPIAFDDDWQAVERWWLRGAERAATSASLLVDRRGIVRWVHPGPEYHPDGPADHARCRSDYADLRRAIEVLLAEPADSE